jgi:NADH-quinone oxidoreductase subunit N
MSIFCLPEIWLAAWSVILLLGDAFIRPKTAFVGWLTIVGVIAVGTLTFLCPAHQSTLFFSDFYLLDGMARFFKLFFLITTAVVLFIDLKATPSALSIPSEYYILPLFVACGLMLLASAVDLILVFVALELVTITFYILVARPRTSPLALEAGVKYLIMGALASGFMVMGIAYVFGLVGSTQFLEIQNALQSPTPPEGLLGIGFGVGLILIGLGFKIVMFPFHVWAPDVYQGAPTSVTAFLSVGSKAAGFVVLVRTFVQAFGGAHGPVGGAFEWVIAVAAAASLVLGNLAAIPQRNFKRMLAYSSIGHSGFILLGILAFWNSRSGLVVVGIYLITYLLATLIAFLAFALASEQTQSDQIHALAGLWHRSPLLAAAIALSLISLAGIPPLVGFMGKLGIFLAAWESQWYALFWVGVGAAVAGLFYYLSVVKTMFFSEPLDASPVQICVSSKLVLSVALVLLVVLGLWAEGLAWLVQGILS